MPFSARKMRTRRGFGAGCSRRASRDPPSSNCRRHAAGYRGTAATSLAGTGGSIILAIPTLMCRSGDLSAFVDRPADIKRLIDFMLAMFPPRQTSIARASASMAFRVAVIRGWSRSAVIPIGPARPSSASDHRRIAARRSAERSFLSRPRTRPAAQSWRHHRPLSLFFLLATVLRRSACRCSSRPPNLAATV